MTLIRTANLLKGSILAGVFCLVPAVNAGGPLPLSGTIGGEDEKRRWNRGNGRESPSFRSPRATGRRRRSPASRACSESPVFARRLLDSRNVSASCRRCAAILRWRPGRKISCKSTFRGIFSTVDIRLIARRPGGIDGRRLEMGAARLAVDASDFAMA